MGNASISEREWSLCDNLPSSPYFPTIYGLWRSSLKADEFHLLKGHPLNHAAAAAAAKSLQSCLTLCDPIDSSPPGSPISGILQARTLEWVAISLSNAQKVKVKVKSLSHVWLLVTPWTTAHQAPPSMGFSRQEYWSGVPLPLFKIWWVQWYDTTVAMRVIIIVYSF